MYIDQQSAWKPNHEKVPFLFQMFFIDTPDAVSVYMYRGQLAVGGINGVNYFQTGFIAFLFTRILKFNLQKIFLEHFILSGCGKFVGFFVIERNGYLSPAFSLLQFKFTL